MSTSSNLMLRFLALPLIACSACGPTYVPDTCDFLTNPAKYEGKQIELIGGIVKTRDRNYVFEGGCYPPLSVPLVWRDGERWPEGIRDEARPEPLLVNVGRVTGAMKRREAHPGWIVEATDYRRFYHALL